MARRRQPRTKAQQAAQQRAFAAITIGRRESVSPSRAARQAHTTLATIKRYGGAVLQKQGSGRYAIRSSDRLARPPIRFLSTDGALFLDVRDSRTRSAIARYWNAVHHYLATGDDTSLHAFRGKSFTVAGVRYHYITDTSLLERLGGADEIRFEDLYAIAA